MIKAHVHEIKEIAITLLEFTIKLTKYSPRPLVVPPAGRGYSSMVNHELKQHDFNI